MSKRRSTEEIKEDLSQDRAALAANLGTLFGKGHKQLPARTTQHAEDERRLPIWTLLAGAGAGFLLLKKPLWPLRVVGRIMGVAAPIVVPIAVSYWKGRHEEDAAL